MTLWKKVNLKNRIVNLFTIQRVYHKIEDCPVWNYNKAKEGNDLRYLYKLKDYDKLPESVDIKLQEAWEKINAEIIDKFGFSDEQKILLYKEKQIELLRMEFVLSKNRTLITKIKIALRQYEKMLENISDVKQQTFEEQLAIIELHRGGVMIDPRKTSILMWLTYLKLYDKYIEDAKAAEEKRKKRA